MTGVVTHPETGSRGEPGSEPETGSRSGMGFFGSGFGVVVLGLVAAAAAVVAVRHPKMGVPLIAAVPMFVLLLRGGFSAGLFVFLLMLNVPAVAANFHGVPKMIAAGIVGLLAVPIFRYVVLEKQAIRFPRIAITMALFQLLQFLGVFVAVRPDDAVSSAAVSLFEGFFIFLLFVNAVRTSAELRTCLIAALAAGGVMGAITVHQAVTKSYFSDYGGFALMGDSERVEEQVATERMLRHAGPIGEKNRFGMLLLLCAPFTLLFFAEGERKWMLAACLLCASTMAAFVLTRSRAGVIATGAMVGALIVIRRIPLRYLVMAAVVVSPAVALVGADYIERVGSIVEVAINASSGSVRNSDSAVRGRLNEMGAAVLVFLDHPLTGVGPSMFQYHYREYAGMIGLHIHNEDRQAHCTFLQVAAEHGVVGLILFLSICWKTLVALWAAVKGTEDTGLKWLLTAILVSYIGYLVGSVFLSFTFIRYFWLLLAMSWVGIDLASPPKLQVAS